VRADPRDRFKALPLERKGFLVFLVVDAFLVAALIWYVFYRP
jgi:hypothetical protein